MSDRLVHARVCLIRAKTELVKMAIAGDDILLPFFDSTADVTRKATHSQQESGGKARPEPPDCKRRVQIRVPWETGKVDLHDDISQETGLTFTNTGRRIKKETKRTSNQCC